MIYEKDNIIFLTSDNMLVGAFYPGDLQRTELIDGVMFTEELYLNNIIHSVRGPASGHYALADEYGKFILRTWLAGEDDEVDLRNDPIWSDYLFNNSHVQYTLMWLMDAAINDNSLNFSFNNRLDLSGDIPAYRKGYDLLGGANIDVGGFFVEGVLTPINGGWNVELIMTFNDIVDPNYEYITDRFFAWLANIFYNPRDYVIRIGGNYKFFYEGKGKISDYYEPVDC
jgi:hypothetical protein